MHPRLELGIFCTESIRDSRCSTIARHNCESKTSLTTESLLAARQRRTNDKNKPYDLALRRNRGAGSRGRAGGGRCVLEQKTKTKTAKFSLVGRQRLDYVCIIWTYKSWLRIRSEEIRIVEMGTGPFVHKTQCTTKASSRSRFDDSRGQRRGNWQTS
ncbi:hypothetical protein EVAR_60469_1 [Eumeta japonica]|uniref:Uncharacterized protein n=1 Tax=Eumeta variegata TaxID=151549 RepID=A0A4C1ZMD3_EUMVA|nr:hypothetical protein EVAR_60469_1 [Eumeta japonica]